MKRCLYFLIFLCLPLWGEDDELFEKIFQEHVATLQHLDVPHPPLMILFSATPGMGKTYIAQKLETYFSAVRLSSDEVRAILDKRGLGRAFADPYLNYCLHRLASSSPNHLVILDRSCDRTYERYAALAKELDYPICLVRLAVPRAIVEEQIRARDRYDTDILLNLLDGFWDDYIAFGQLHVCDFMYANDKNRPEQFMELVSSLGIFYHLRPTSRP